MHYELTNTKQEEVTVDGLGVLPPNMTVVFTEEDSIRFARDRGVQLTNAYLPEGVTGVLVLGEEN